MILPYSLQRQHAWWIFSTCVGICGWFLIDNPTPAKASTPRLAQYGWPCPMQARGSTATVFRCLADNGTLYGVKRFRKPGPGVSSKAYVDSVQHEVRLMAQIQPHRHILGIVDFFSEEGRWYMVMPFVSTSLWDHTLGGEARALSVDEIGCVFYQLLNGVAFLHQLRVAHLDLKLNNVLITQEGEAKLIDFGQALFFDRSMREPRLTSPLGTSPNVPWEAYHDEAYNPFAADAWALGIIYCQAILPTAPWYLGDSEASRFALFTSDTPNGESQSAIMDRDYVKATVEMILRHLPLPSYHLIGQLLDPDPANRMAALENASSYSWYRDLRRRCSTGT
ncbi:checkpoint kinase [Aspergillus ellipticus CBS 707.79]|uniref:Checkpoint kinase n=1 Tax=Aspergillus ellipticus CBS 707.79 TaxID=1448320 RepID=A0A319DNH0_9EURO|nr:checkpoint kinase [Aspergillus ellipticus CBS 707.79]